MKAASGFRALFENVCKRKRRRSVFEDGDVGGGGLLKVVAGGGGKEEGLEPSACHPAAFKAWRLVAQAARGSKTQRVAGDGRDGENGAVAETRAQGAKRGRRRASLGRARRRGRSGT